MPTIKELVDKHSKVPGDIRITHPEFIRFDWLKPFFVAKGTWYGTDREDKLASLHDDNDEGYELYEEPKPKVKRAQYMFYPHSEQPPWLTSSFFKDTEEAYQHVPGKGILVRLDETELEFDR